MRTATRLREWQSRIDPRTVLVGAFALIVYELHGFDGFLSRDLALYSYGAQQVADGVPPYVGMWERTGPLAQVIPAIGVVGARVGGFDELLGMRLQFLLIAVACVCVVYLLGRDLFASPLAGLASAAAFLSFSGFIEAASNGPREKTAMVLFLLCTMLAIQRQRWLAAGISLSLATLVLQPIFFVGIAAVVVGAFAARPGERIRALVRVAVGGLIPVAVCLLYFAVVGAFREFIDAYLLINLRYTVSDPLLSTLAKRWPLVQDAYGVSLWVMIVGLVALVILSLSALRREKRREDPMVVPVAAFGAASLAGLAWIVRDFDGWPDVFPLLPMAAIGIGGIANVFIDRLPARAALALTMTWVVAAVAIAVTYSVTEREHKLTEQRRSVAAMLEQVPSDASLLSIHAPQALVLSGKTNPTRYQMFSGGMDRYIDDTYPGGLQGFGEWIEREQPTLITLRGPVRPWMAEMLETEYRRAGKAPGWHWYVHRSVGPDVSVRNKR